MAHSSSFFPLYMSLLIASVHLFTHSTFLLFPATQFSQSSQSSLSVIFLQGFLVYHILLRPFIPPPQEVVTLGKLSPSLVPVKLSHSEVVTLPGTRQFVTPKIGLN